MIAALLTIKSTRRTHSFASLCPAVLPQQRVSIATALIDPKQLSHIDHTTIVSFRLQTPILLIDLLFVCSNFGQIGTIKLFLDKLSSQFQVLVSQCLFGQLFLHSLTTESECFVHESAHRRECHFDVEFRLKQVTQLTQLQSSIFFLQQINQKLSMLGFVANLLFRSTDHQHEDDRRVPCQSTQSVVHHHCDRARSTVEQPPVSS